MSEQQFTDFFDPEIQKIVSEDGCSIYRMKNVTGEGVITRYEILPGIELFYNDFHMSDGQNQNKLPHSDVLEINHCREGRFECEFANGDYQYVGAGDLAINRLTNETTSTYFPLSHYHGISITIDLPTADQTMKRIESVIGGLNIDVFSIADKFCKNDTCVVLRTQSEIEHIFSELYRVEPRMIAYYLKVKVLELLMFLNQVSLQDYQEERRYFARNQVQTIKKMQEYMTADLRNHYTLQELSEKFEIPLTSMKVCFKGVYGCSIYAYMKSYRMQAATILLRDTSDSITEIAAKMGYDNPSKFSEVFKKDIKVRLRPGFFPFVEPGFELDISCLICGGEGCPSCKHSGWLELCPCGMIHPNVLREGGIDPEKYTGFAFGLGLTRLAMMKYGIKDIRDLNSGSLKALSQFTDDE